MATYLSLLLLFACASTSSSNPNSCRGRCGEGYYRGSLCQCDYECLGLNECCTDFQDLCTSKNSCKGRCGEPFNRGNPCHCDIDCVPYSQCCPDYESMCLMEDTALKPRNTGTAAQRTTNLCLNIKNKKSTESSNEEMTNEEGTGEELVIPEDESESTPSEGYEISPYAGTDMEVKVGENSFSYSENETTPEPNSSILASSLPPSSPSLTQTADASSMFYADENPIESTTQQPSEEMTSSTPQPQENASTAPTESPTITASTEGPTSTTPTESPTSTGPTQGPASTASTEGPTSTASTEGPTSTGPTQGPTSTAPTEGPTSTASTEGPTSTASTEGPTSTAPTEGPTSTAPTEGPTESPTSTASTQGPTSTAPTESPTSTASTQGPTSTAPTEGPTSRASTEVPTSASATNSPEVTVPMEYFATEMTTMAQGEDPKESSSLKDSRATSVPKTPSTNAPVKPTKNPTQPSTDKNDKSEPKESPVDPSGIDLIRPVKQTLKPSSDKNGKTDSIKDYQADDYDTNLCSGRPVSGLTTLRNGTTVVFRGHYFWTLDKYRNPDPPQLITRVWGIPSPIDTVYTRCNCQGKTYFFKGKEYWRFENGVMDSGFPKPVSQGFGQIGHITAALSIPEYRSRKESVIFFKRGGMAQTYTYQVTPTCGKKPKIPMFTVRMRARRQAATALGQTINISKDWRGFPTMVTSAVSVPSRVKEGYKYYVFSQRKYYSIKMERKKPVILKSATGPRENSASSFFKCQETQKN